MYIYLCIISVIKCSCQCYSFSQNVIRKAVTRQMIPSYLRERYQSVTCSTVLVLCGYYVAIIPATATNGLRLWRIPIPDVIHYIVCPILVHKKEPVFPFWCWVPKKGTPGTIFITSLVWRGPWLGIEPGTSRTRSQHTTTRLSKRRLKDMWHSYSLCK